VCSHLHTKAITEIGVGVIIKDLRPINFVDVEEFQSLMNYVEPRYHIPSATYFTKLIECRYEELLPGFASCGQHINHFRYVDQPF